MSVRNNLKEKSGSSGNNVYNNKNDLKRSFFDQNSIKEHEFEEKEENDEDKFNFDQQLNESEH